MMLSGVKGMYMWLTRLIKKKTNFLFIFCFSFLLHFFLLFLPSFIFFYVTLNPNTKGLTTTSPSSNWTPAVTSTLPKVLIPNPPSDRYNVPHSRKTQFVIKTTFECGSGTLEASSQTLKILCKIEQCKEEQEFN